MANEIPWEQIIRRQYSPEEIFQAVLAFQQGLRGGGRRDMSGFLMAPTPAQQVSQEEAAFRARFPLDRAQQAIQKEQAAFGDRLPSFTQQEMASRGMTPQERINQRMGPGWADMDPTQRRVVLQRLAGQTPDYVNPLTNQPTQQQQYGINPGQIAGDENLVRPSLINGMPAQQAIAQATQQANQAEAAYRRQPQTPRRRPRQPFLGMF
jgi:hypothetical protein